MSTKIVFVGDVHAVPAELEDCNRLLALIRKTVEVHHPDAVIHLGDGFHTHGIIHAEIVDFWQRAAEVITAQDGSYYGPEFLWILGNHETIGVHDSKINALQTLEGSSVTCVTTPQIWNDFLLVPYQHRNEDFAKITRSFTAKRAIVHQSFQGAQFEAGYFDPSGVDPDLIPQPHVVSGHIHKPQRLGDKIWYPGSPRSRTLGDANTERAIYVCEYDDTQVGPVNTIAIPTDTHCRSIFALEDRPGAPVVVPVLPPGAPAPRVHVDVYGPPEYVRERKVELEGTGYRVRTFPDQVKKARVRESDGIAVAAQKYVQAYVPKNGSPKAELERLAKERLSWLMK